MTGKRQYVFNGVLVLALFLIAAVATLWAMKLYAQPQQAIEPLPQSGVFTARVEVPVCRAIDSFDCRAVRKVQPGESVPVYGVLLSHNDYTWGRVSPTQDLFVPMWVNGSTCPIVLLGALQE